MSAEQHNLFDSIEGVDEEATHPATVSGDQTIYRTCNECGCANGRHDYFCTVNLNLWDDEYDARLRASCHEDSTISQEK